MRNAPGDRYRFLAVGQRVRYVGRAGRAEIRGGEGRVTHVPDYKPVGAPKNVVAVLDGGAVVVAPAGCFRAVPA